MKTAQATGIPRFSGKPLIEVPKSVIEADLLRGDHGQAIQEEVQGRERGQETEGGGLVSGQVRRAALSRVPNGRRQVEDRHENDPRAE